MICLSLRKMYKEVCFVQKAKTAPKTLKFARIVYIFVVLFLTKFTNTFLNQCQTRTSVFFNIPNTYDLITLYFVVLFSFSHTHTHTHTQWQTREWTRVLRGLADGNWKRKLFIIQRRILNGRHRANETT